MVSPAPAPRVSAFRRPRVFRRPGAFRYWSGRLHLWLGLASGLVVFVVSLTGALFSFQQEVSGAWYHDRLFVAPAPRDLPLTALLRTAADTLRTPVDYITTYRDPARAWEFMSYKTNDTALTYFGSVEHFRSVFIDPHTGRVTGFRDYKHDFFNVVKYLHWSLLLNTPIGQPIVGWATLIFVLMLLTGLILWWPRRAAAARRKPAAACERRPQAPRRWTKSARRQAFTIRWDARKRRLNYDLHNVLGFYTLLVALVLGLTGMVFAFAWFSPKPGKPATTTAAAPHTVDAAFEKVRNDYPRARRIGLMPEKDSTLYLSAYDGRQTYYDRTDVAIDLRAGKRTATPFRGRSAADKLVNMNYDIHVGAIGGLPGKILAFLVSLVCASLPVTGFLYWLWRKKPHSSTTSQYASFGSPAVSNSRG